MQAQRLVLDENHATDLAAPRGEAAPARGWIVELQARADGIWGRVDWTASGRALVADRAYRGISPALRVAKADGRIIAVLRASLVNHPNFPQLTTLHHQQQEPDVDLKALRAALGLAEDADDAAILAAAAAARTAVTTHAAQIQRIAEAAKVSEPAKAGADEIVTALNAAGAGDVDQLRATVVTLQAQLNTVTQEKARDRATAAIDKAIKDGKPIVAIRDHYITRHMADPAGVEKELAALPSLHAGGLGSRPPAAASGDGAMTGDEASIVALLGVDRDAYAKAKKAAGEEIA
jgi:phage I-like protein